MHRSAYVASSMGRARTGIRGTTPMLSRVLVVAITTIAALAVPVAGSGEEVRRTPKLSPRDVLDRPAALPVERRTGFRLIGGASCVETGSGIECFARGPDSDVLTASFAGGAWSRWRSIGGIVRSDPSCFAFWPDLLTCIATGQDGRLWATERRGTPASSWTGWTSIAFGADVQAGDGVHCVAVPPSSQTFLAQPREAHCFAWRGNGQSLARTLFRLDLVTAATNWQAWRFEPDRPIFSAPQCSIEVAVFGAARSVTARCASLGPQRQLLEWWGHVSGNPTIPPSAWRDWGGTLTSAPSCVEEDDRKLRCAGRGLNGQLWSRRLDTADTGSAWSANGGALASDPACVYVSGKTSCLAVGQDNRLWRFDLGSGSSYVVRGTAMLRAQPRCLVAHLTTSRLHCFVPDANFELVHYEIGI